MPRKDNRDNPLLLKIRAVSVPRVSPERYWRTLDEVASGKRESLPEGWEVELHWKNPEVKTGRSKDWQVDEMSAAVAESSEGFNGILRGMIGRKLSELTFKKSVRDRKPGPGDKRRRGR